jgi:hypothetical protein
MIGWGDFREIADTRTREAVIRTSLGNGAHDRAERATDRQAQREKHEVLSPVIISLEDARKRPAGKPDREPDIYPRLLIA